MRKRNEIIEIEHKSMIGNLLIVYFSCVHYPLSRTWWNLIYVTGLRLALRDHRVYYPISPTRKGYVSPWQGSDMSNEHMICATAPPTGTVFVLQMCRPPHGTVTASGWMEAKELQLSRLSLSLFRYSSSCTRWIANYSNSQLSQCWWHRTISVDCTTLVVSDSSENTPKLLRASAIDGMHQKETLALVKGRAVLNSTRAAFTKG